MRMQRPHVLRTLRRYALLEHVEGASIQEVKRECGEDARPMPQLPPQL
jgi:hypothetical protein